MKNGYFESTLDNGLVVALQKTKNHTVFGKLRVNYGVCHERKGEEGLAHFLEHCLYNCGSENYSMEDFERVRDSFRFIDASVGVGRTSFIASMLKEDLQNWLKFISGIAFNSLFDERKIEEERGRVLRDIADEKSEPSYGHDRRFREAFYRSHPKAISISGSMDVIRGFSREKLVDFYKRGYTPSNVELIIAGDLPKNALGLVEKNFGGQKPGMSTRLNLPLLKPLDGKVVIYDDLLQMDEAAKFADMSANLRLAYVAAPESSPDSFDIRVMSYCLGGDQGSRLFKRLSYGSGLVYGIGANYEGDYNAGSVSITANVPARRLDDSLDLIFDEINCLKRGKIDAGSVERIKRFVRYDKVVGMDSNGGCINTIERWLDYGLTPEMWFRRYSSVDADSVVRAANECFSGSKEEGKYALAIRNPLKS